MDKRSNPFDIAWVARTTCIVILILITFWSLWALRQVVFMTFGGLLLAIVFRYSANALAKRTSLGSTTSLVLVILAMAGIVAAIFLLTGPRLGSEFGTLAKTLPEALGGLEEFLRERVWGLYLLENIQEPTGSRNFSFLSFVSGTFSTVFAVVANIFVVLSVSIFLALNPTSYREHALLLVPKGATDRVNQYFDETGEGLFRWFIGQLVSMGVVAALVAIGLYFIGTPVPIALGVIAGVTNFIPFLGPYIGGAPAVLIAFSVEPISALWVAILIFAVQTLEGNVITPNIQQKAVNIPPAMIILVVVGFGAVFGILGIMLATPMLYALVTAVRMFYVEDALEKDPDRAEAF